VIAMRLPRYYDDLEKYLLPGKVLVILGPRQVGKTTLVTGFLQGSAYRYRLETGEDVHIRQLFQSDDIRRLREFARGYDLVAIDEAQRIPNAGQGLKLLVDHIPDLKVIATGSSSFELAGQVGEPLTGRKTTLVLYPLAQLELLQQYNRFDARQKMEEMMILGSYPEILVTPGRREKIRLLHELSGSYMFKDILELERVKGAGVLLDLLRLLAFQIGNEVSHHELGKQLGIDSKTVGRYLDLFEKAFILFKLRGFSRNLRKEITRKSKYYFYDTGLRNAVIANFNPLDMRNDTGMLWENFLMIERLKKRAYHQIYGNPYFWRTWSQQEVDLIEEREGNLYAYEFKWKDRKAGPPREFADAYPRAEFSVVSPDNYLDFIS